MDDEKPFLRQLMADPDDLETRLVYADWLDERGDCDRAEFLRLECDLIRLEPTDLRYLKLNERYQELHSRLDPRWLAMLDRTPIDNCRMQSEFRCPRRWEYLQPGSNPRVRWCETCSKEVYHCRTIEQARELAQQGHCLAIDSRLTREPGDLFEEFASETLLVGAIAAPPFHPPPPVSGVILPPWWLPNDPPPRPRKRWWQFWK